MPKHRVIHIKGIDPIDQNKLILDEPELDAESGDTVQWVVLGNSGVDRIEQITEKDGFNDVWITRPIGRNNWRGTLINVDQLYTYEYNIFWKKGNNTYKHDPKISINPTKKSKNLLIIIITFLGLSSIIFFLNKKFSK
jgi:hypothetical protein